MKNWSFAKDNDKLIELVLSGKKTATSFLYSEKYIPTVGEKSIIHFDNEKDACEVETVSYKIVKFKDVTSDMAVLEGEGDLSLEYWKNKHYNLFKSIDKNFNKETKIIFETFNLKNDLVKQRLKLGERIAYNNLQLLKKVRSIYEINAGYNNTLFSVNDKYVIKVCNSAKNEKTFEKERDFYLNNQNNRYIPKFFKYDDSKLIVPFVYEIIEKVKGETLYYHWYKMSEEERECVTNKFVNAIKKFHKTADCSIDFESKIKSDVSEAINKCKRLFTKEEFKIVMDSLLFYDEILSKNQFVTIHNDLHFDNIIYYNGNVKIIDFNDYIVAPIDYEFRLLYMSMEKPWKWANIEMDPYQKPEDFSHLFDYIKKYYKKLNNIKYLDERMNVYKVHYNAKHLVKYKLPEQVKDIVDSSKLILEKFM